MADVAAERARDLVQRQFQAERPNQRRVTAFTDVAIWRGFVYVAFVIDVFSRRIVGWPAHIAMRTDLVLDALEQGLYDCKTDRGLVVHSERGFTSLRHTLSAITGSGSPRSATSRSHSAFDRSIQLPGLPVGRVQPWKLIDPEPLGPLC